MSAFHLPRPSGTWRGLRVAVKTVVVHDALLGKEVRALCGGQ